MSSPRPIKPRGGDAADNSAGINECASLFFYFTAADAVPQLSATLQGRAVVQLAIITRASLIHVGQLHNVTQQLSCTSSRACAPLALRQRCAMCTTSPRAAPLLGVQRPCPHKIVLHGQQLQRTTTGVPTQRKKPGGVAARAGARGVQRHEVAAVVGLTAWAGVVYAMRTAHATQRQQPAVGCIIYMLLPGSG